ncbi:hypothetical protein KKC13_09910 [bacterium]|nr:hypothetical protein [bacterium]MBU1956955.1 hypothetical protein [bacterium]
MSNKKRLFILLLTVPLLVFAELSVKEVATKFEAEQKVLFVPIAVGGITIIIPAGSGLPADPGEEGNVNIEGIDSDNDGIRDDVERHISLRFKNKPKARAYSYVIAQKYQKLIENPSMSLAQQQGLIVDISEASDCVDKEVVNGSGFTMPYVLNTYARSLAYVRGLKKLKGTILPKNRECR